MRPTRFAAICVVAALGLLACAAIERPPATIESLGADVAAHNRAERAVIDRAIDRLADRLVTRGDRTLDILLLSGGGQHGAYGIGFLRGWKARPDAAMPMFDLVTGVSTGALQAPYALVGTTESLDVAAQLYRRAATDFAPTPDYLYWLRRTGGVVDITRFRNALDQAFDAEMAQSIARASSEGRQLLVATSDFDLGVGRTWNLPDEMARPDGGPERAREIVIASCSIPGILPPVIIDGHVHADGGVIANALFPFDVPDFARLSTTLRERGVSDRIRVRLWIIVNVWTQPRLNPIDPANRAQIAQRQTVLMFFSSQAQLLARLELLSRTLGDRVPGITMEMRYTAIPQEYENAPGVLRLFDQAWMQRVEGIGYTRAQSAYPWDRVVSPYERAAPR